MNLRTVIVLDWDGRDGVEIQGISGHRSLSQPLRVVQGTPITALRTYLAAVEETENRWKGIPD